MPLNITATNGTEYHLWQLPDLSAPEPEDEHEFTTLDNEMAAGFRTSLLFGSNTGVRTFKLTLPTLSAGMAPNVTDINGASVSREQYLRTLFASNKRTGKPFVYQWPPSTGQYYLVDFVDEDLTYTKTKRQLIYNTSVTLKQRRLNGVTVFDINKLPYFQYNQAHDWYNETSHGSGVWTNKSGDYDLDAAGDVIFSGNPTNGLNTVRFNSVSTTGTLSRLQFATPVFDLFIVMKMRQATFSGTAAILAGSSNVLLGTSGNTKFENHSIANLQYFKNGEQFAVTNQQAPMDTFGVVHLRIPPSFGGGIDPATSVMGASDAKVDLAEIFACGGLTMDSSREITEHLMIKWGITA